ncbi:MAG: hypothetical protein RL616_1609, partial [Verrucomicrobiota bacterium]
FNPGWKFIRADVTNAETVAFDDAKWNDVSAPHTYNDVDSYTAIISHSGGDRKAWAGIAWYRKHFKLPASAKDGKVFLEFEGLKQAGRFWVNGKLIGRFENGITACGLDLTGFVNFGDTENVIAVKVDNSNDYQEEATGAGFEWMGRAFNPNYGGLNHDIWLHLAGKVYQTLPLYENLKTTGLYVWPSNFSVSNKTCDVNLEAQVRNESGDQQSITLSAVVVDADGKVCAKFLSEALDLVSGQTEIFSASGKLADAKFWSDETPNLYDVYSMLTVNDKIVDVQKIKTGFRKTEFKGGVGTGGVYLNDKFVWLTGYAQRSSDEWAGLGQAYPDWMHDYNAQLIRSTHANYIRWMHVAPQAADVRACDKTGIVQICPAGDKEGDPVLDKRLKSEVATRQWEQRMEVMRDTMIYFRNNPSIVLWEAGNNHITTEHLNQMVELRKQWDPNGGRAMGCRTLNEPAATPVAEYFGVMIGQDDKKDSRQSPTDLFRAYSDERRDRAPFIETEDFRDEAARRFWDDFSPPHFGFKKGPNDTYDWNSETFCIAAAERYYAYALNTISNTNAAHSKWAGYASIYWSDSNADGRQDSSEVCRVSGKVDSVRLPKSAYYVYRVMQNSLPDIQIIGHWNYPTNTVKTIYVAANHCDMVELFVNDKSVGKSSAPMNGYIYPFPEIKFAAGEIFAVAKAKDIIVSQTGIKTAGEPNRLKLTPIVSPEGFHADGADVALFDVEVVDANGQRCPTDEARVDFKLDGPAIWRGGYNSGKINSINNLWLDTECGINRVAIRATQTPGKITLTAIRAGLEPATARVESK